MLEDIKVNSERWFDLTPLKNEIWKPLINYEEKYLISNYGRIKSLNFHRENREKILKFRKTGWGNYWVIHLCKNGIAKNNFVHRLVAKTFIPNVENKPQINHIDGNQENCKAINLEWVTAQENSQHAHDIGLQINTDKQRIATSNACSKRVSQYDKNGNFIKTYKSMKEAQDITNIKSCTISLCCNKKKKTAGGFIWKKEE